MLWAFGVHGGGAHFEVLKSPIHFPVSFIKPRFYKHSAELTMLGNLGSVLPFSQISVCQQVV